MTSQRQQPIARTQGSSQPRGSGSNRCSLIGCRRTSRRSGSTRRAAAMTEPDLSLPKFANQPPFPSFSSSAFSSLNHLLLPSRVLEPTTHLRGDKVGVVVADLEEETKVAEKVVVVPAKMSQNYTAGDEAVKIDRPSLTCRPQRKAASDGQQDRKALRFLKKAKRQEVRCEEKEGEKERTPNDHLAIFLLCRTHERITPINVQTLTSMKQKHLFWKRQTTSPITSSKERTTAPKSRCQTKP